MIYELRKSHSVELHFLNGSNEVSRFRSLPSQYRGPFFRYYSSTAPEIAQFATLLPTISSSLGSVEDAARELRRLCPGEYESEAATKMVLDFAENSDLGLFDGLLGFSEGVSVAANVLIKQARNLLPKPFKCAVFLCNIPPVRSTNGDPYLADECGQMINIPTTHVLGEADAGRSVGLALLNLCATTTASLLYHKQGHEIARSPAIMKRMAKLISEMLASLV